MIRFAPSLIVAALLFLASIAFAQETPPAPSAYHSPKGCTLLPPAGWDTISATTRGQLLDDFKEKYPGLAELDFSQIEAVFFGPVIDTFAVNINIVTFSGSLSVSQSSADDYARQLQARFNGPGMALAHMTAHPDRANNLDCIIAEYELTLGDLQMKQWQYIVPGKKHSFIVTFSCPLTYADAFRPTVQSVMAGFTVDAPASARGTWSNLPPAIRYGIAGAIAGAILAPLIALAKKRKAQA